MGVDLEAPLGTFLEDLASRKPTPGGGSAAALAGAVAAALVSMVCRLTLGKKGYEGVEEEMQSVLDASENLRVRLQALMGEDANAYEGVVQAFRMDQRSSAASARRRVAIQEALRGAASVPLETARRCVETLHLVEKVASRGNVHALSDVGSAAHLALAAFRGARLNVEANLSSIKDSDYVDRCRRELDELEEQAAGSSKDASEAWEARRR